LISLRKYVVLKHKNIHVRCHKTAIGIVWSAHDGFSTHIETRIYDHRTTGPFPELTEQPIVSALSLIDRLNPR